MENFRDEGEKRRFLTKTARGVPYEKGWNIMKHDGG